MNFHRVLFGVLIFAIGSISQDGQETANIAVKQRKGFSPKAKGITRHLDSKTNLTEQVENFEAKVSDHLIHFDSRIGSSLCWNVLDGKRSQPKDSDRRQEDNRWGGRKKKKESQVNQGFSIDVDLVSVAQFRAFVGATKYVSEAEQFGWSFVFEQLASPATINTCDSRLGRVKDAPHWLGVEGADWRHPHGPDSSSINADSRNMPVTHMSYNDATEYCTWAGLRLPLESEWEYAARGGMENKSYPWGSELLTGSSSSRSRMNVWEGEFKVKGVGETSSSSDNSGSSGTMTNTMEDGYLGVAPLDAYPPQTSTGLRHMLGNVWEWVQGGSKKKRVLRGGSFIDSIDGTFNHIVLVSTRQLNSGDSTASNIGFRCVRGETDKANEPKHLDRTSSSSDNSDDRAEFERTSDNKMVDVVSVSLSYSIDGFLGDISGNRIICPDCGNMSTHLLRSF
eukprot:gene1270-2456_t